MRTALALAMVTGCIYVPAGDVEIVDGPTTLTASAVTAFALYCDLPLVGRQLAAGAGDCHGAWGVEDPECGGGPACAVEGGNEVLGVIDRCGVYTAPVRQPPAPLVIVASECSSLGCPDTCAASLELTLGEFE